MKPIIIIVNEAELKTDKQNTPYYRVLSFDGQYYYFYDEAYWNKLTMHSAHVGMLDGGNFSKVFEAKPVQDALLTNIKVPVSPQERGLWEKELGELICRTDNKILEAHFTLEEIALMWGYYKKRLFEVLGLKP